MGDGALRLDGYEELTEIGRGGFGVVYRAREVAFGRDVAIKVIAGVLDPRARARFDRERLAIGSLSGHPNIVTVHATGLTDDARPYIVMEYVSLGSLADRLRDGPLPWPEALEIGVKLAFAVQSAHDAGVLHRDIKPENVLVSAYGEPKLADFGIAQIQDATATQSGVVTASVAHAAPEVLEGKPASVRSDVYSLGSTIYALIAGQPAFVHDNDESVMPILARIANTTAPDLRHRDVPGDVCQAIEGAMAKDPEQRVPSATQLRTNFERVLDTSPAATTRPGATTRPVPAPGPPRPRTPSSRRPLLVGGGVAAALAAIAALGLLLAGGDTGSGNDKDAADPPQQTAGAATDDQTDDTEPETDTTTALESATGPAGFGGGVGDCFENPLGASPPGGSYISSVVDPAALEVVSCDSPHRHEVVAFVEHPAAAGSQRLQTANFFPFADAECVPRVETYLGGALDGSGYVSGTFVPDETAWANGERTVVCTLADESGSSVGSAEGAAV